MTHIKNINTWTEGTHPKLIRAVIPEEQGPQMELRTVLSD